MGAARGQLAAGSANSGELPPWPRWGKNGNALLPRLNLPGWKVEEVEEVTARLQADEATRFRGGLLARQRRCLVGNGGRPSSRVAACCGRRGKRNGEASAFGRRAGWLQGTAATPGGARRVASATASRRRAAHTRPAFSETVGHCSAHSVDSDRLTA